MNTHHPAPTSHKYQRQQGFLLGLIVALALLFTALEYTSRPADISEEDALVDRVEQDLEALPPPTTRPDMMAVPEMAVASQAVTENVRAVEHSTDTPTKVSASTSPLIIGEGEGAVQSANVEQALPQVPIQQDTAVLRTVEKLPEFPGGMVQFMKWLTRNLRYPTTAQDQRLQGKVVVSFIVNKDGSTAGLKVEHSAFPALDAEVLRVLRTMPRWKPGMMEEKPCRTLVTIPVVFNL